MRKPSKYWLTTAVAGAIAVTATAGWASSHREAPAITEMPKVDGTDFYMFRSYEPGREDFVTLIANYQPLQTPYGGPNYFTMDPDAIYEIHIDNDGDAVEDITFQFEFFNNLAGREGITLDIDGVDVAIPLRHAGALTRVSDPDQGELESYSVTTIFGDRRSGQRRRVRKLPGNRFRFPKPMDNVGDKSIPDYEDYASKHMNDARIVGCFSNGRVFAGQRAEAFAVNLGPIFDLVNFVPIEGSISQNRSANDDLIGESNVTTLAIEVPISCLVGEGNGVIGGWTTASLPEIRAYNELPEFVTYDEPAVHSGNFVQQSRLGSPLVNELVIGLVDKNRFNASEPLNDADPEIGFGKYVTNPTLPALLEALFGVTAPTNFPRNDLVAAFLTGIDGVNQLATVTPSEMLRLNTAIPPTPAADQSELGVIGGDNAGFPNGRRPGDDVVDIALRVVMGKLCTLSIGCVPADAPSGDINYTDGAPLSGGDDPILTTSFPYLSTPLPGAEADIVVGR